MGHSTVTLRCGACGSDQFERSDNPKPEDKVTCAGCGATGTYGEAIESGKKQILHKASTNLKKAFKGVKGFKSS